jgi:hypothetical protein
MAITRACRITKGFSFSMGGMNRAGAMQWKELVSRRQRETLEGQDKDWN